MSEPFDGKSSHSGLLCKHITLDLVEDWLWRGISLELIRVIFIVDIVSNSNKLAAIVRAGKENDGDAQNLSIGDSASIWRVGLEDKLVDAYRNRTNEEGVEFLIVLVSAFCKKVFSSNRAGAFTR